MRRLRLLALVSSAALHLVVMRPVWLGSTDSAAEADSAEMEADEGEDQEGELPIEELADVPFRVSIYQEVPVAEVVAVESSVPAEAVAAEVAPDAAELSVPLPMAAAAEPVLDEPPVVPEAVDPAELVTEADPEPVLSDEERAALAAMERGEGEGTLDEEADAEADADAEAGNRVATRTGRRAHRTARTRVERKPKRPPCPDPVESIARTAELHWYIDRDLIEHYATNLIELQKLGAVWTHRDEAGKLDGFRVGLARCSVLRQGGLRSGDVVHDINGRRINSVIQAIGAYIALRAEPELRLNVTRRGAPVVLAYTIEQPERRRTRRAHKRADDQGKGQAAR